MIWETRSRPYLTATYLDHSVAAVHAEVDVEVGHGDAFGIQEALKQQIVIDRIQIGDAEAVGHERSRTRTAPGTHGYAVLARPLDEVRHDEEVTLKSHLADDIQLETQSRVVVGGVRLPRHRSQAPLQTPVTFVPQELCGGEPVRDGILRQACLTQLQNETATLGDSHRIGECFRHIREQRRISCGLRRYCC